VGELDTHDRCNSFQGGSFVVLADDIVGNQKGLDHLIQKDGRKLGD
jgi:hypothetical protein